MKIKSNKMKTKKTAVSFALIAAICIGALFGDFIREDSLLNIVVRQGKNELYLLMLKSFAPAVFYEEPKKKGSEYVLDAVLGAIPVYGYVTDEAEYAMQDESEISYESIIAREALDENYIDETTGELVRAEMPQNTETEADVLQPEAPEEAVAAKTDAQNASFVPSQVPAVNYSKEKLNDFDYLIQNFYVVDRTTTINSSQLNAADLLSRSMKLTHGAETPQILVYHTHSQERFADSVPQDTATSIVGVGEYLCELLRGYGFSVIHHMGEYDVESRDGAYSKAGPVIEQILKENPGIEIVIDLHRDGVAEGTHLVTDIQGKQTASIMFFNGLSRTTANGDISYLPNPYIQDNLAFSLQMQIAANEYYPGFSRAIYLKGYRYNMHYCPKTLLVEAGAQTNTVQEMMNAMEPLADILAKVISP